MLVFVVFPPPQSKVAPAVVEDAVNVELVLVHVSTAGVATLAFGTTILCVTVVEAAAVHPLAGSVAVTP